MSTLFVLKSAPSQVPRQTAISVWHTAMTYFAFAQPMDILFIDKGIEFLSLSSGLTCVEDVDNYGLASVYCCSDTALSIQLDTIFTTTEAILLPKKDLKSFFRSYPRNFVL